MTFDLFEAFQTEWRRRPPVHWLVSWYLEYKPPVADRAPEDKPQYMTAEAAKEWMRMTGGKIAGVKAVGTP